MSISLVINQLQFGVAHTPMLDQELFFNMTADQSVNRSSEILEYCRLKDIAIQPGRRSSMDF